MARSRVNNVLIPNPLNNDSQYARFYHFDIEGLEDVALMDELYALRSLLWRLPPEHWLRERVKILKDELAKRNWDTSKKSRERPKPKLAEGVKL